MGTPVVWGFQVEPSVVFKMVKPVPTAQAVDASTAETDLRSWAVPEVCWTHPRALALKVPDRAAGAQSRVSRRAARMQNVVFLISPPPCEKNVIGLLNE
jgi:hypothetical protein